MQVGRLILLLINDRFGPGHINIHILLRSLDRNPFLSLRLLSCFYPIIDVRGEGWGRHELAGALGDLHLPLLHYYPTSCDDPLSNTVHLHALENVKVHSMMVGLSGDGAMLVGVPDHNVCIGAWRYQSFLRVEIENFGRRGGGHSDKPFRGQKTCGDTPLPDNTHSVLQSVHAVRDLGKIVEASRLLCRGEGTVVCARTVQISAPKQLHKIIGSTLVLSERRRENVGCCMSPAFVVIILTSHS